MRSRAVRRRQRRRGVPARVGLDFASETLLRVRRHEPDVPLVVGDINALPFPDEVFDAYFSGGVVEHLESGPDSALREAARVTRVGGVLLISVPYLSPLRRLLVPFKRAWQPTSAPGDNDDSAAGDRCFRIHLLTTPFREDPKGRRGPERPSANRLRHRSGEGSATHL